MEFSTNQLLNPTSPFTMELYVQSQDLHQEWRRCNMLANYVAEYVAYQFPEREWAESLISTVTNEFLEALTYISPPNTLIILRYTQFSNDIVIHIEHSLQSAAYRPYIAFVQQLAEGDTDELYLSLLTAPDRPEVNFNQFGMVMLVHDFKARIATHYEEATERISISINVPTQEISA